MNGLHWCARRNYVKLIKLLALYGAEVNARDASGRTPIYVAAKYNHEESVKALLALKADPSIKCLKKLNAETVTNDDELKIILKKGRMFQVTSVFTNNQRRQNNF
jgi:ankyrin repeat protein